MNKIDKYTVVVDGVPVTRISPVLVARQNILDDQLVKIIELHKERITIERTMQNIAGDRVAMVPQLIAWTNNQCELQKAWGFKKDSRYHKFWNIPACTCPKFDNNDRYPSSSYIYNEDCPLHGW